jgi:hypothetical protein
MKYLIFLITLCSSVNCLSQPIDLDLSLPQPRLGQSFYISFSSDTLSKQIFNLPPGKFKINSYASDTGTPTSFSVNLEALKIGQNEIGPFTFKFNGNTYKTKSIKFTVADSLPNVDKGIWFRKVPINDTAVYIMIDQRIPAHSQITQKDSSSISMTTKVDNDEGEARLTTVDTDDVKIEEWGSYSETKPNFLSNELSYGSYYKCYKVTILNKSKPFVLTSAAFKNLPAYNKFQNITVH